MNIGGKFAIVFYSLSRESLACCVCVCVECVVHTVYTLQTGIGFLVRYHDWNIDTHGGNIISAMELKQIGWEIRALFSLKICYSPNFIDFKTN